MTTLTSTSVLLVACDYDGTIAPIVDEPQLALPIRESIIALRSLSALPDTHVAVISGRSLRDLAALSRLPPEVHLVGSHGSEFDPDFAGTLTAHEHGLAHQILDHLLRLAARFPGSNVEQKPAGAAFHYRALDTANGETAAAAVLEGPGSWPGVHVKRGKMVLDLSVIATDKGSALERLRHLVQASAAVFVGDDLTDEDAFATLAGPDLGVKVGQGRTRAAARLTSPSDVSVFLARLFEERRAWLEGDQAPPIQRHTLLSDQRCLALVTPEARVSWLCHPRADSPSTFAELLGGPSAGSFAVRPDPDSRPLGQRYAGNSMIVETTWAGLRVTDYLDASHGRPFDDAGVSDLVRVLEGDCPAVIEFAPRPDFGRAMARLELCADGLAVVGSGNPIRLVAPGVAWDIVDDGQCQRASARVELHPGRELVLQLQLGHSGNAENQPGERARRQGTGEYWNDWVKTLDIPLVAPTMVRRSALVLKSLCHQPTGAIAAAATTSLPEVVGGSRNWDYRFCWPRDAAIAADALARLGSVAEGVALLDWLAERLERIESADALRPLYPLAGDEFVPEAVIPTLNGYRGSRPVRIGNLAEHQLQLDMFAPIVQLTHRLATLGALSDRHWVLTQQLVDAVSRRWHEPDHGIWEIRGTPRHYVHSKMMCWATVERALSIAHRTGRVAPPDWEGLAGAIADDVIERGWNSKLGSFSSAYDDDQLDASLLQVALIGLLDVDDPRVKGTVNAVERRLRRGPVVYRYHFDDGLPGKEGGFLLCSSWLIEAMVATRRIDDAQELFAQYVDLTGPTGMLSEQYDPGAEMSLGNVPQAYSHAGLINAAAALSVHATGRTATIPHSLVRPST